ncbi:DUF1028 domain-containing protein [Acidianus ambivalens]|uniref:DUF1028 domain-containing protein n=1 Tax=Acidianus ambivalens TaxID=2283 RepID=A0A650CWB9_ACIAM|nr:DUF1028 domain-containing protein [Acidianus ambivalens]MQL54346.1 DUF1028 domain-containing protein [Acidianus ambivalens]QGR22171.1 DUF1028 domain-containing protein [Acidianus ambivalens]
MTFSIVVYDPNEEAWGVGVASKFLAVGSLVPWLKAGVGAIATQALANLEFGRKGLELLEKYDADKTLKILIDSDPLRERRQVGIVDSKGLAVAFTGKECHPYAGHIVGDKFTVQGNILAGEEVLEAMAKEAEGRGKIYERILRALKAGEDKGGDRRGKQSAAIIVVKKEDEKSITVNDKINPIKIGKYVDVRVDDHKEPIKELERILNLWISTFIDEEMVNVSDYSDVINKALKSLGYSSLRDWVEINNFEAKYTGDKIGKTVLKVLLDQANIKVETQ